MPLVYQRQNLAREKYFTVNVNFLWNVGVSEKIS